MSLIASRLTRIKPSPSSMAGQRARELQRAGRDVISLTAGEPDFNTPANVVEAALRAMKDSKTKYTDVGGTPELRAAVCAKLHRENALDFSPDEVVVGAGCKQVIFSALMCTIEAGDEVIVPSPYWVSYPDIALLADGAPVIVPCSRGSGFKLQPADLDQAISARTKWVILNGPNNPSGACYSRGDLTALAEVLRRHPHVWVMTDDIYEHLVFDGSPFATMAQAAPDLRERILTVNGVSKAYAMTGWRIGYGAGPKALVQSMVKLQSQSTSNASSIGQAAAVEALSGPQDSIRERLTIYQARRDLVVERLNAIPGLSCHTPEGAFYAFASCAGHIGSKTAYGATITNDSDFIAHLLEDQKLAVLQGAAYGMSPYFRVSFAASTETLEEGLRRLRLACASLTAAG